MLYVLRSANSEFLTVHLLPRADSIIALDTEGKIAAQGTFAQLNAKDGYIHRYGLESLAEEAPQAKDGEKEEASKVDPLQRAEEEAVPKVIDDEARRLGDRTVYKYYFQQVGALNMTIFFAILLIWIFMLKFPGTSTTHSSHSRLSWLSNSLLAYSRDLAQVVGRLQHEESWPGERQVSRRLHGVPGAGPYCSRS